MVPALSGLIVSFRVCGLMYPIDFLDMRPCGDCELRPAFVSRRYPTERVPWDSGRFGNRGHPFTLILGGLQLEQSYRFRRVLHKASKDAETSYIIPQSSCMPLLELFHFVCAYVLTYLKHPKRDVCEPSLAEDSFTRFTLTCCSKRLWGFHLEIRG